ncbi:MAG: type II secretion system protein GspD [Parachlamydiales bacterium]
MKWFLCLLLPTLLSAETISEKCARMQEGSHAVKENIGLEGVNARLKVAKETLLTLQREADRLYQKGASDEEWLQLRMGLQMTRGEIAAIEAAWRDCAKPGSEEDPYALFHQPWTSLEQLVADYGSSDFVYIIPPEVAGIRLTVASHLPVPREAWDELLSLVLTQNGVGIRQLSPLVRQLYLVNQVPTYATYVTDNRALLATLPPTSRVAFVLTPAGDRTGLFHALHKFAQPGGGYAQLVGRQIFLFSSPAGIQDLLKLCDFMEEGTSAKQWRLITLDKLPAKEMAQVLELAFPEGSLRAFAPEGLPSSLFVIGAAEEVARAGQMAEEVEREVTDPKEVTLYTYTAKHSDAEELAETLGKVYPMMVLHPDLPEGQAKGYGEGEPSHFVVYPKTGTIVMAVRTELLPKLKNLIRTLDVPKKMVKIEVLFFEKKISNSSRFGFDLLKVGQAAGGEQNRWGASFGSDGDGRGICQFLLNQTKRAVIPAYDLIYSFLLSQEDVRINASPSVTTVNHTPAKIQLVEEISIDTGVTTESDKKKTLHAYERAEYGITLQITPNINPCWGEEGDQETITLETEVEFDTPKPSKDNRPSVVRRRINNQVRIPNGETVILGGLRSKMDTESSSGLPFLGELPGIGKLFSSTTSSDHETEMFIFITPTIIEDPVEELRKSRQEDLAKRPGDIPEFLQRVADARAGEREKTLQQSLGTLFGKRKCDRSTGNY